MNKFFIKNKIFFIYLISSLFLVISDQLSKIYIVKFFNNQCGNEFLDCSRQLFLFFNFTFVCNHGVSFGFLSDFQYSNIVLSVLTIGILTVFLRLLFKSKNSVERTGFLFIASGAIGNIIDRFRVGCVVDFLHFHYHDWHFAVFNLADSFISIGGAVIIFNEIIKMPKVRSFFAK